MQIQFQRWRRLITVVLPTTAWLFAPPSYADSVSVVVQRIDASQFPNVRAHVSVATPAGIPVTGLDSQAFVVQEDGKPVDGLVVDPIVDSQEPITTALVIDVSGSMADEHKLEQARDAATAYVDALGPNDRATLVSFSSQVNLIQDYTPDKNALKAGIGKLTAQGNTLLYDAISQTAQRQSAQTERRKPLIVLTDGEDTASAASLGVAISAVTTAGSPVYAVGLGSDVNRDVLTQIAAATGGQAVFVSDPGELKTTFLSISDQLRRQYVLRYASKLSLDTSQHGLAVQATYAGQQATGLKSFTMPAPARVTIAGLSTGSSISGVQHVTVDVSGGAQLVQLLVDDQPRAAARSVPTAFDWDTSRETSGAHHVVVRVTDAQGVSSDTPFSIGVAAPAPLASPLPTVQPAVATPAPIPAAASATAPSGIDSGLLIGLVLLLFLIVASAWYLSHGRVTEPAVVPAASPPIPPVTITRGGGDMTEEVGHGAPGGMTFIRAGRERTPPQVRLAIVRNGQQTEFVTHDSSITLGRLKDRATVVIQDPLVSSEHARIRRDGAQFFIEDLKSKNGTQLNGEPLAPETPRVLKSNDRIDIGDTVVTFVIDTADRRRA